MQKVSYAIKLWHKHTLKYEDLGMFVIAEERKEALDIFKKKTGWINKEGTVLIASPPLCR